MHKHLMFAALIGLRLNDGGGDGGGDSNGSGDTGGTGDATTTGQTTTPKPSDVQFRAPQQPIGKPAATTSQRTTGDDDAGDDWDGKVESLPKGAQDLIKSLRGENAKERTAPKEAAQAARAEIAQQIGKALGLVTDDDEAPDAEQLTKQVAESRAEAKSAAIELAVFRSAKDHGGDPNALTDSRSFLAKVADLDPKAQDFTTKVTDAAKAAVAENPSLKAAQAAGQSTVEHPGGSGERTTPPKNLNEAVARAYGSK